MKISPHYPTCLKFQSYLLVGIKGVGMASLASVLIDMGKQVRGWDVAEEFVTQEQLDRLGVNITDHEVLPDHIEAVIYTAAHHDVHHPLVQQAIEKGLPVYSLAEATGALSQLKPTIAVCGVGGKSTTSAMLAWIFEQTTHQASYMVGVGEIKGLFKTGAWSGTNKSLMTKEQVANNWFMVEADEYATNPTAIQQGQSVKPRFFSLNPDIIICTQILHDHPDVYPTIDDTLNTFEHFFQKLPNQGLLIVNEDDVNSQKVISRLNHTRSDIKILQVGNSQSADLQIIEVKSKLGHTSATIKLSKHRTVDWQIDRQEIQLQLSIPGQLNIKNASAALAAALQTGLSINEVLFALQSFQSTTRRLEKITEKNQAVFYDDYAHHPQEITASIQALRSWYPDLPLTIIFQPHTYSRTKSLLSEFASSLAQADQSIILPIFASARESNDSSISSQDLVLKILEQEGRASFAASIDQATQMISGVNHGLIVTMGAGDVYLVHEHLKLLNHKI